MADSTAVAQAIAAIETEMKRIGMWQTTPLEPEKYDFKAAFGLDVMAYSQWLQFIFIPRVKDLLDAGGPWPSDSHVGAQAVREFDGSTEAGDLVSLLSEFDALFGR